MIPFKTKFAGLNLVRTLAALVDLANELPELSNDQQNSLYINHNKEQELLRSTNWRLDLMKELLHKRRGIPEPKQQPINLTLPSPERDQKRKEYLDLFERITELNRTLRAIAFAIGYNTDNLHTSKIAIPPNCTGVYEWKQSIVSTLNGPHKEKLAQQHATKSPGGVHVFVGGYCTVYIPTVWIRLMNKQYARPEP